MLVPSFAGIFVICSLMSVHLIVSFEFYLFSYISSSGSFYRSFIVVFKVVLPVGRYWFWGAPQATPEGLCNLPKGMCNRRGSQRHRSGAVSQSIIRRKPALLLADLHGYMRLIVYSRL